VLGVLSFALLLGAFLAFLALGVPVFFSMGLASMVFILVQGGSVPLNVLASSLVQGIDSFSFLAIPFFFLAGDLMNTGGVTQRLLAFSSSLVGHVRGGLSHVAIVASMIFSGVSGSAVADASAIGSVMIPAMKADRYPGAYAAAVVASAATMGPIIPPSIAFVVYALLAEVSVGRLFLAGVLPGVLMGVYLMAAAWLIARRRHFAFAPRASLAHVRATFGGASVALVMPAIIMGGIVFGVVTPTEAGVVAVVYGLVVGVLVFRDLPVRKVFAVFTESMINACTILLMIAAAGTFSWLVANMNLGELLVSFFTGLTSKRWVMLLVINVFFLIWGLALDIVVGMVVMVPLLIPIVKAYGIDLVQFGVIVTLNLMIGELTPPSGVVLFISAGIAGAKLEDVFREAAPFALALVAVLALVTYVPALSLWLPGALMGR
jgi:tripartite ATP-independent transporter DctM subunit